MPVSLIAAVAANRVIGRGGMLPWRLAADMAYFKGITMGHTLVMGRKTFQTIGKPIPGRRIVVLTRDPAFSAPGCLIARSPDEAMARSASDELFVAGGAEIFALFLPLAERLYITHVDSAVSGDTLFPEIDYRQWRVVSEKPGVVDEKNPLPHRFVVYEKRR